MRQLHELLRHLSEAYEVAPAVGAHRGGLRHALDSTARLARGAAEELLALDVAAVRDSVNPLLLETSERVRAAAAHARRPDRRGADLRAADLRGALFLTQPQVAMARGDGATRLPAALARPAHWPR